MSETPNSQPPIEPPTLALRNCFAKAIMATLIHFAELNQNSYDEIEKMVAYLSSEMLKSELVDIIYNELETDIMRIRGGDGPSVEAVNAILLPIAMYRDLLLVHEKGEGKEESIEIYDMCTRQLAAENELIDGFREGECLLFLSPSGITLSCDTVKLAQEAALKHIWRSEENGGALIVPKEGNLIKSYLSLGGTRSMRYKTRDGLNVGELQFLLPPELLLHDPSKQIESLDDREPTASEFPESPEDDQKSE